MSNLIADIGGTNVRFGIATESGVENIKVYSCAGYPTPADAAHAYLAETGETPVTGAFAVASPLDGTDRVAMTNHVWDFSIAETAKAIGLKSLRVINDFEALAVSMPYLSANDMYQVGPGEVKRGAPMGIIGPGTGLGVAGVVMGSDGRPVAVPGEGGHVTMPATNPREFALFQWLKKEKYHHISAERVCSGKGLVNLYHAICGVDGLDLPDLDAPDIAARALDKSCRACVESLDLLCYFLGVAAGNLALTLGAFGGVYVAGGIIPQIRPVFDVSRFREGFESKGRYQGYMKRIPTFVVTHPYPGLEGLKKIA